MTAMKQYVLVVLTLIVVFFTSCANQDISVCEHCGVETETANHLIGQVDMTICEDCHESYLQGDWGSEYEK